MKATDPDQDLQQLFQDLVGGELRPSKVTELRGYLSDRFQAAGLEQKLRKELEVTVPVLQRPMKIPFSFQNGRFNLIRPTSFGGRDAAGAASTAFRYAGEGRSLFEHPNPTLGAVQLVVVGDFGPGQAESRAVVERILGETEVRLVPASQLDSLIEEIRTTAKDVVDDPTPSSHEGEPG
jgi:hypothetical protein